MLVYHVWKRSAPDGEPVYGLRGVDTVVLHLRHGVTLFFVLSGFLLFRPFAAAAIRNVGLPSIRRYFVNRALRLLPAYWVILVLCALLVQNYSEATLFAGIGPACALGVEAAWYGTSRSCSGAASMSSPATADRGLG